MSWEKLQTKKSNKTEVTDINSARYIMAGAGTTTSGIVFGGDPSNSVVESWNGSSWTEVNDLNQSKRGLQELEQIIQVYVLVESTHS